MIDIDPVEVVFANVEPQPTPELVLVVGQPGAGTSRLQGAILEDHDSAPIASVAAENFAAFHPEFLELTRWRPLEASGVVAPQVAEWIGRTLDHASDTRRSLLFETSVSNPGPAIATAGAFEAAGFRSRLVIVATPRYSSLLSTASRYLNARRLRLPARFVDRETHTRGWIGTRSLAQEVEATSPVDRLTILNVNGDTLFDARREEGFVGATTALEHAMSAPVSVLQGARWFGELRGITDFARRSRELTPPVTEVLIELHQLALSDVLPSMPVPRRSSFKVQQEARLTQEIVSLRRELPETTRPLPQVDLTGPVVTPAPSRGGPSL